MGVSDLQTDRFIQDRAKTSRRRKLVSFESGMMRIDIAVTARANQAEDYFGKAAVVQAVIETNAVEYKIELPFQQ